MSSVDFFRNWNVPCRYFITFPVDFKGVQCRLSNLRKDNVALSNLRVKGPTKTLNDRPRHRLKGNR